MADGLSGDSREHDLVAGAQRPKVLYGRADNLERIDETDASVLVVTGDSGVGKSELLARAQQVADRDVTPPPVTVNHPSGALQQALLEALAQATATLIAEAGLAAQVSERIQNAARRLAAKGGQRLAQVVAAEMLNLVKARLGDQVGSALGDYLDELRAEGDEALERRIRAQMDPPVAETVLSFAGEVADLAGDRRLILALDAVEELGEEDFRLLLDLSRSLPEQVRLRLGFATFTEAHQGRVEDLLAVDSGVVEHRVEGLGLEAVEEWLVDAGLDGDLGMELRRVTDGYPLVVGDVIDHLVAGGRLEDSPRQQQFIRRTQQALRDLDRDARQVARKLSVLSEPLPEPAMRELAGLDAAAWGDVVERLRRARILSSEVNGHPWFHELRRLVIAENLGTLERENLSAAAAEVALAVSRESAQPRLTAEVANLMRAASASGGRAPSEKRILDLNARELAVMAAAIELFEPQSGEPLAGDDLLQHARVFFGGRGDLVSALEHLADLTLVSMRSADNYAFVLPTISDRQAAVLQGRALQELGRLPLPGLGSSVFYAAIRPRLEPYEIAVHGLGLGSYPVFAEMARGLSTGAESQFVGRGQGYFLLLRFSYYDRQMGGAVSFATTEDRDRAQAALEGLSMEVLGGHLEVTGVRAHPGLTLPADHFARVLERLGVDYTEQSQGLRSPTPPAALTAEERAQRKVDTRRAIAECASPEEREIFGLDGGLALHWHYEANELIEAEVFGSKEWRSVRHDTVPPIDGSPYLFFRFSEAFEVREDEQLAHINMHFGDPFKDDPVVEMLSGYRKRVCAWNDRQRRMAVSTEPQALAERMLTVRRRQLADARRFAELGLGASAVPPPRALYVVMHESPDPQIVAPFGAAYRETASPSGEEEVHVAFSEQAPPPFVRPGQSDDLFEKVFDREFERKKTRAGGGVRDIVVARFLGYRASDIDLVDAQGKLLGVR